MSPCPLCRAPGPGRRRRSSRPVDFAGRRFEYLACPGCGSLVCTPMPDATVLAALYDSSYAGEATTIQQVYDDWVLATLAEGQGGRFIDYGCGDGRLLERVRDAGWDVAGVEYDPAVVASVRARTGLPVVDTSDAAGLDPADVLHLGDVLEHLTELPTQLPEILRLLRPGGMLLAQGPLEGNRNLFALAVGAVAVLRPGPTDAPPYHVLQATSAGQLALFREHGLDLLRFDVSEDPWPAPATRPGALRPTALWALRRASMAATRLRGGRGGNRYRYVGRLTAR